MSSRGNHSDSSGISATVASTAMAIIWCDHDDQTLDPQARDRADDEQDESDWRGDALEMSRRRTQKEHDLMARLRDGATTLDLMNLPQTARVRQMGISAHQLNRI